MPLQALALVDPNLEQRRPQLPCHEQAIARTTYLIGPDGKVQKRWDNVKVNGHADEVLDAIATT